MTTPHPPLPASLVEDLVRLLADALMADLTQFPHPAASDKNPASVASTTGIPPNKSHEGEGETVLR